MKTIYNDLKVQTDRVGKKLGAVCYCNDHVEVEFCSFGLCDGGGRICEGRYDDIEEKDCLCVIERKQELLEDSNRHDR